MTYIVLFGLFFFLILIGAPIALALVLPSAAALIVNHTNLLVIATNMYSGMSKYLLLAIPFFVLSGNLMAAAGISDRLVAFIDACVGHRRGGIAVVCVIVACFFGAISGSGAATTAALGVILIPAMVQRDKFSTPFATSVVASSASIAAIIPPSIAFVVYAAITGVSVGDIFIAGIIPGIVMGLAIIAIVKIEAHRKHLEPSHPFLGFKEVFRTLKDAIWGMFMPVIILGGIYGGLFSPTEAASVACLYGFIVGLFIYKSMTIKDCRDVLFSSLKSSAGIMFIIGCASLFSYVCTRYGIAAFVNDTLGSCSKMEFLIIVNIIFLIAGCFVDSNSAMYIFIPFMAPVAQALGVDMIHFGMIATVNLCVGQFTPPVGVNLFVAAGLKMKGYEITVQRLSKAVLPFIAVGIGVLLLITYVPWLTLCLIR